MKRKLIIQRARECLLDTPFPIQWSDLTVSGRLAMAQLIKDGLFYSITGEGHTMYIKT